MLQMIVTMRFSIVGVPIAQITGVNVRLVGRSDRMVSMREHILEEWREWADTQLRRDINALIARAIQRAFDDR